MDVRKNAADLTDEERDKFLKAIVLLNNTQAEGAPEGVTRYDQFVVLHIAIFDVYPPGAEDSVNYGHWSIGFCPWHRQFVRDFEKALQEVAGDESITVPYWDWADHVTAMRDVFTGDFLGSLRGIPQDAAPVPLVDSVLRNPVPAADQPAWWPTGVEGYPIHSQLGGSADPTLYRGTTELLWNYWQSEPDRYKIINRIVETPRMNAYWYFRSALESGAVLNVNGVPVDFVPTHDAGHNLIGGHMSGRWSPNDPAFWLHHANVDRLWADWQAKRLQDVSGSTPESHYPPPEQESPGGDAQPEGHKLRDVMWPWVGTATGYGTDLDGTPLADFLPDYSHRPPVHVEDVLDTETIDIGKVGYRYAPPGG